MFLLLYIILLLEKYYFKTIGNSIIYFKRTNENVNIFNKYKFSLNTQNNHGKVKKKNKLKE